MAALHGVDGGGSGGLQHVCGQVRTKRSVVGVVTAVTVLP